MLSSLPWTGDIVGVFSSGTVDMLAAFLTNDWLSDNHIHWILENYSRDIADTHPRSLIHLDTSLLTLIEVYGGGMSSESTEGHWLKRFNTRFTTGDIDRFGFMINVNGNHWVACVLDFRTHEILYGDSFHKPIRQAHLDVLRSWADDLLPKPGGHFNLKSLPITSQSDGFSCGILATNALASYCSDGVIPLISETSELVTTRLKTFLEIANRHNELVGTCIRICRL
ncbi:hypothetical protein DFP72DRAFT_835895 [Ephemerocybe angulata]|uniref:Ubiquitin-like protease family profile domain-containing protein n=1 Tax=Ephemerocybe angulata TaxID=980116 RepID=A0A8H6LU56_9AGAR|nr:hypothetical protein DFP72DRAFT_835895 [Tulosesus angulatus]